MSHDICPLCGQETDEPVEVDRSTEATIRAEAILLRAALLEQLENTAGIVGLDPETHNRVNEAVNLPTIQREVERVRAMERVVEIVGRILPMTTWWVGPEVDELRAAYEQLVKEKP